MGKYVENWTPKELKEGEKYAEKKMVCQIVKARKKNPTIKIPSDSMGIAFVSSDSRPGYKIIANTKACSDFEGVVVRLESDRSLKFIEK